MNFRLKRAKISFMRRNLEKSNFYEDIIFENKFLSQDVKKVVANWIYDLQEYKHIEIKKFKELFNELNEIVFPIKIKTSFFYRSGMYIEFLDAQENEYYISRINMYDYYSIQQYIIGRTNSPIEPLVDRKFYYQICEDGTIILKKTVAMDEINEDAVVDFCYNYDEHTTESILRSCSSNNEIKIKYPTVSAEFDKLVLKFLFENESKWYYYDVFPILEWIVTAISDERVSISVIAEVEKEIVSEIDVVNGIVQKYTVTQIINKGEMHIIKKILAKELREFLAEKN